GAGPPRGDQRARAKVDRLGHADDLPDGRNRGGVELVRHCERSEAIQKCIRGDGLDCFVALLPCANASRLSHAMTTYCSIYAVNSTVLNSAGRITSSNSTSS